MNKTPPELEVNTFEVIAIKKNSNKAFLDAFHFGADTLVAMPKGMGEIFGVIQVTDFSEQSEHLPNLLIQVIKKEFYKRSDKRFSERFESALHKGNIALSKLAQNGITNWVGQFHVAIGAISGKRFIFTQVGNSHILLNRKNKLINITKDLALPEGKKIHPIKTFQNVSEGNLDANEKILLVTRSVLEVLNWQDLQRHIKTFSSDEFDNFFKSTLEIEGDNAGAVVVNINESEVHKVKKLKVHKNKNIEKPVKEKVELPPVPHSEEESEPEIKTKEDGTTKISQKPKVHKSKSSRKKEQPTEDKVIQLPASFGETSSKKDVKAKEIKLLTAPTKAAITAPTSVTVAADAIPAMPTPQIKSPRKKLKEDKNKNEVLSIKPEKVESLKEESSTTTTLTNPAAEIEPSDKITEDKIKDNQAYSRAKDRVKNLISSAADLLKKKKEEEKEDIDETNKEKEKIIEEEISAEDLSSEKDPVKKVIPITEEKDSKEKATEEKEVKSKEKSKEKKVSRKKPDKNKAEKIQESPALSPFEAQPELYIREEDLDRIDKQLKDKTTQVASKLKDFFADKSLEDRAEKIIEENKVSAPNQGEGSSFDIKAKKSELKKSKEKTANDYQESEQRLKELAPTGISKLTALKELALWKKIKQGPIAIWQKSKTGVLRAKNTSTNFAKKYFRKDKKATESKKNTFSLREKTETKKHKKEMRISPKKPTGPSFAKVKYFLIGIVILIIFISVLILKEKGVLLKETKEQELEMGNQAQQTEEVQIQKEINGNETSIESITKIEGKIISITGQGEKLFVYTKENKFFQFNTHSGELKEIALQEGIKDVQTIKAMDDLQLIFFISNKNVWSYSPTIEKFYSDEINLQDDLEIAGVEVSRDFLYILNGKEGQIYRYPRGGNGFIEPKKWLSKKIGQADFTDIAVDDSIRITYSDGRLEEYFQYKLEDSFIFDTDPKVIPHKILAKSDVDYYYVLDKENSRVNRVKKEGDEVQREYFNSRFKNSIDFWVNEENENIFVAEETGEVWVMEI